VVLLLVYAVSTLPGMRSGEGFVPLIDGWVQGTGYVAVAVLCLLRSGRRSPDGSVWAWMSAGLVCHSVGFVLFLSVVRLERPLPYPSVADGFWLAAYVFVMAGLVSAVRGRSSRGQGLSLELALDGVAGALATAALATAFLFDTLAARVEQPAPTSVVVTNLAYPVLDVMLLVTVLGVLATWSWQPPRPVWLLALGIAGFAVTDIVFLIEVTAGDFHPGTWLSPFALLAAALIAGAAWVPGAPSEPRGGEVLPGLVPPGLFAATSLSLLVYATEHRVSAAAVLMAALGLVVAIFRTGLAFRTVRQVALHRAEARTDELTGLQNRRAFHERLASVLYERPVDAPAALLVLDLDDFKAVNDTLGHHHGDDLLRQVATRLGHALRGEDQVARLGGDEFAIILDGSDDAAATRVAERLGAGLRRSFAVASRDLDVRASIGIALFPEDGKDATRLLQHADLAMYQAKSERTGHSRYRRDPHHAELVRLESVDTLRRGIENREIVLHYQPVVDLSTGAVRSVEALARWSRADGSLVPPGAFLSLAERGGLMGVLTADVLEQAVHRTVEWRSQGVSASVAVNMSVTNLLDVSFPDQVAKLLDDSGLPGEAVHLELTEDLFMADPTRAGRVIAALLETGVRLVVDDYGTGFSSLGYLRDLQDLSGLKLDRSFVTHVDTDLRAAAIVESTVTLAGSLGLTVIAEGVETPEQLERLKTLGADFAQGYHLGRPGPLPSTSRSLPANASGLPG
jgi:diguanylate cyclase (GGDEF)-like protein